MFSWARQMLICVFWISCGVMYGCIPPASDPDPTSQKPTSPPPDAPKLPELPALEGIPGPLRDAHDLLSQGHPADATHLCEEVAVQTRSAFLEALRGAQIDGSAANAQRVRDLLAEHFYANPPLLVLARDRFILAPDPGRLCLRAAWLAGREDLKAVWHEDLQDALQAPQSQAPRR